MLEVLLAIRCVLAAVLATAGVLKLLDGRGSRRSMREFGVPVSLTGVLAVLVPLGELVSAWALVSFAFAWHGAVASVGLLVAFNVAIALNLVQGRTPDCHCFGKFHSE